jgi:hypothetical protein
MAVYLGAAQWDVRSVLVIDHSVCVRALRPLKRMVGRGEDRLDRIRGEEVVELASTRMAQYGRSRTLPAGYCSNCMPESRSSGAIRSERAVAEVEQSESAACG